MAAAASVAFIAIAVAGCGLLFPGPLGGFDPGAEPSPIATFTKGHATLAFGDGTKVELDTISHGPHIVTTFGSNVHWSNADGWSVGVVGAGAQGFDGGELELSHIADHKHLMAFAENRCIVTVPTADKDAIRGTATCKGLRWMDTADTGFMFSAAPSNGPSFDVEVTFEATR